MLGNQSEFFKELLRGRSLGFRLMSSEITVLDGVIVFRGRYYKRGRGRVMLWFFTVKRWLSRHDI